MYSLACAAKERLAAALAAEPWSTSAELAAELGEPARAVEIWLRAWRATGRVERQVQWCRRTRRRVSVWRLVGDAPASTLTARVLWALDEEGVTAADLALRLSASARAVRQALRALHEAGQVEMVAFRRVGPRGPRARWRRTTGGQPCVVAP